VNPSRTVVKGEVSVYIMKGQVMKTYGSVDPRIRNLDARWSVVITFTLRPLYPHERSPGTHFIGLVGTKADLGGGEKRNLSHIGNLTPILRIFR
jgi:hypothetical protein